VRKVLRAHLYVSCKHELGRIRGTTSILGLRSVDLDVACPDSAINVGTGFTFSPSHISFTFTRIFRRKEV